MIFLKGLVRPQGDSFARCDRQPTALQDDHSGSAKDHVVVRPLADWLLGGRQGFLVVLIAVEVLGWFTFSADSQECAKGGTVFRTYDERFSRR